MILCSLMFVVHGAYAQFGATISGIVADPSGAIVPGAPLTLRNTATNEQRVATSSGTGRLPIRQSGAWIVRTHHDDEGLQHVQDCADT